MPDENRSIFQNNQHNNAQSNTILQKISTVLDALETCIRLKHTDVCCNAKNLDEKGLKIMGGKAQNSVAEIGLGFFYKRMGENEINTPEVFANMTNKISNASEIENNPDPGEAFLLMIPGFDGNCDVFKSISERLKIRAVGIQLDINVSNNSIEDMASDIAKFVKRRFRLKSKFYVFGYCFGVDVALELARMLEKEGHVGLVYCLDSSPDVLRVQLQANVGNLSCIQLQDSVISHMYKLIAGREDKGILNAVKNAPHWTRKVDNCVDKLKKVVNYTHEYLSLLIDTAYKRIIQAQEYELVEKLQSELILMKNKSNQTVSSLAQDYNLSKYSNKPVQVYNIERDHETAPRDCRIANIINSHLDSHILEEIKKNTCDTYLFDPNKSQ